MPTTVSPSGQPFVIQTRLTRIAMAVQNAMFIADQVAPRVKVDGEKFSFTQMTSKERLVIPDTKIGRTGHANEVEFGAVDVTDRVVDHGLEDPVPLKDIESARDANNFDPLAEAAEGLSQLMLLAREQRVATLGFSAANYATGLKSTLTGDNQWNSGEAGATPLSDISTALDAMLVRANTMVLGQASWTALRQNPQIVEAVLGTAADVGNVSRKAVAELFEIEEVLVGSAWYDTAKKGQAASNARLWGKHCALLHVNPAVRSARSTMPAFAFTGTFGEAMQTGTYMDPKRGVKGCEVVKVIDQSIELISWQGAGYLFTDAAS